MAQTTFKSITITAAILIIASFAVGYFVTTPAWAKYSQNKTALSKANTDHENLQQSLAAMRSYLDSFKSRSKDVTTANLALPVKSLDIANLTSSIDGLAKASGIILSNFSAQETRGISEAVKPENSIQAVTISLSATGTYASLRNFILRLESNLRIMDLSHIALKADDSGVIQYDINFNTYYQK